MRPSLVVRNSRSFTPPGVGTPARNAGAPSATEGVDAEVDDDAVQPGVKGGRALEVPKPHMHTRESVLHDVLGVVVERLALAGRERLEAPELASVPGSQRVGICCAERVGDPTTPLPSGSLRAGDGSRSGSSAEVRLGVGACPAWRRPMGWRAGR